MPRTMNITTRSLVLALLSLTACGPEAIGGDWGDDDYSDLVSSDTYDDRVQTPAGQCQDYPGSLGCSCADVECMENLTCVAGHCTTCPNGSPGCPCGTGEYCEIGECNADTCGG